MGKIRDAERTRQKILNAAKEEFCEKGYTGARIESIAKRAGLNKQLIYHYFKNKEALIDEMISYFAKSVPTENLTLPSNPVDIASFRFHVNIHHLMDFLKFTAWEVIDDIPNDTIGAESRKKVLQSYVEDMKVKQEKGLVPKDLDPRFITLMMSSLTIYPLLYGKVTQMITGLENKDEVFIEEWSTFLDQISERIFLENKNVGED
ncbi:TetR/AcrR family transcriptional regulator [Gracilibacillus marinus]|uniref:TetR/AcrR family transcriptional regulator n=1 Tax=Gracilibacillus marinus TaxID=630535 RepID=A0ABV8VSQ1_9BACI